MKLHLIAIAKKYNWEDRYTQDNPNIFIKIDKEIGDYISFKVFGELQSVSGGSASTGIVDRNGKEIVSPKYISIDLKSLVEGESVEVSRLDKKGEFIYGILSPQFKEVVPCKFNSLLYFSVEDKDFIKAGIKKSSEENLYGLYDAKTFELLLEPVYSDINIYTPGLSLKKLGVINKDGKIGFIDYGGNLLIEPKYDEIEDFYGSFHGKLLKVIKNGLVGLVNTYGIEIVPPIYSQIDDATIDLIPVKKENTGWGLININGKLVTPLKFSREELIAGRPKDRRFRVWQEYEDTFEDESVKKPSLLNKLKDKLKSI